MSKICEEIEEVEDARAQGVRIMELAELADLYGAIRAFLVEEQRADTWPEDLVEADAGDAPAALSDLAARLRRAEAKMVRQAVFLPLVSQVCAAMEARLNELAPGYGWDDLRRMAEVTERAFRSGRRS